MLLMIFHLIQMERSTAPALPYFLFRSFIISPVLGVTAQVVLLDSGREVDLQH